METNRGRKKKEVNYNSPFAARLRELLAKTGTTQPMLAKAIGTSRQAVGQWKDGNTLPDISALAKVADYFNVSADYLIGRSDVKSIDPSQKIQAACEVTGLSEKAVDNLIEIKKIGLKVNLLLENKRLKDMIKHLGELEQLAINKRYWEQVIDPLINSDDFFDNLRLNDECLGKPKCKRYNDQYPDDMLDCHNCERYRFRETDSELIFNLITKAFDELLEWDLGIYVNTQADCSSCYQDNADLEHFKLSKLFDTLINDIQENADCSAEFELKNQNVRKKLVDKLHETEKYIKRDKTDTQITERYIENIEVNQLEVKALQTYLNKYDENFKLKKQKGVPDNGSNNPQKE